ncbi:MAG: GNAT family N-acetyltransferase [bacterium]|nr:GNAT family N-acetyltransferase [bacterium]
MEPIRISHRKPTVSEFLELRKAVGWFVPTAESTERALRNTLFAACIEHNGSCIGSGRVVGDGALVFYIQDVIVRPQFQRQGCGKLIMDALMNFIHKSAAPTAYIGLFSARGLEPWYSKYGFVERPQKHLGPGMAFFKQ